MVAIALAICDVKSGDFAAIPSRSSSSVFLQRGYLRI